jgi:hypothetical protein
VGGCGRPDCNPTVLSFSLQSRRADSMSCGRIQACRLMADFVANAVDGSRVNTDDHLVRKVAAVLDLSWVYAELPPHYSENGRPSIDPS